MAARATVSWFLSLLAAAGTLAAQSQPKKLITFDIIAVDANGNRIGDLRADELRVDDNGKRMEIAYFRRGQDVTRLETLADRGSNHGFGTFPQATAVLFDQLNTHLELTGTAWDSTVRALARVESAHDTYLYVLLKNGTEFPIRAIPESWVEAAPAQGPWTRRILPAFEDMRHTYEARPMDLDPEGKHHSSELGDVAKSRQTATETALQDISMRLNAVPGFRSLVWVGPDSQAPITLRGDTRGREALGLRRAAGSIRTLGDGSVDGVPIYYVGASPQAAKDKTRSRD